MHAEVGLRDGGVALQLAVQFAREVAVHGDEVTPEAPVLVAHLAYLVSPGIRPC